MTEEENNKVNEPSAEYKSLRVFHSLEEMNEANAAEQAVMSGPEHLSHTTALIKRVYAKELQHYKSNNRIHFS